MFITFGSITIESENIEKSNTIKRNFVIACDGSGEVVDPLPNIPSTHSMGVVYLDYDADKDSLIVTLTKPGILIGRAGATIDELSEFIGCKIEVKEHKLV